jgi:hypothetical protein
MVQALKQAVALSVSWAIVCAGLTWPSLAYAAYGSVPAPTGYTGTGSARSYARAAASTYSWAAGKVTASTTMNVGGRAVPMTVRFTAAADAVASMASYARTHPALWGGVAVASWLAPLLWDAVQERWEVPGTPTVTCVLAAPGSHLSCTSGGAVSWMNAYGGASPANGWTNNCGSMVLTGGGGGYFPCTSYRPGDGTFGGQVGFSGYEEQPGEPREATEEDWDEVEAKPFPNAVPNEVVIPVPVEYPPVLNPQPDGDPGTLRVPLGEPYAVPGTDPQEYRQPAVDIVPSPTLDDPFRVDLQPKNLSPESPEDGLDGPELVEDGDEIGDPGVELPPSKLCEDYPDISACAHLGEPPGSVSIPTVVRPLDFTEQVTFGPSTAACPAPAQIANSRGLPLEFSYAGMCSFMDGIRPIVVGLAYLTAVLSFFGIRRD